MSEENAQVYKSSLAKVKQYYIVKNYGRAYAHFILCLELDTASRPQLEDFFIEITLKWCKDLKGKSNLNDCIFCYNQALRYYPRNAELLSHLAEYYMSINKTKEAISYYEQAHTAHPNDVKLEKNLQSIYAKHVPQWHYRMINDKQRNSIYKQAIEHHLQQIPSEQPYNVVDIGAGSGLLSLFAGKFTQSTHRHQTQITAIEESETMCEFASNIFQQNCAQIKLYQQMSTEFHNQHVYNLLITEIFDCGLFGEGVLSTLIHAHKELLTADAVILPHSAKLYIFGIESRQLDETFRFNHAQTLPEVIFPKCLRKDVPYEPYDAVHINLYDYKRVTTIEEIVNIDFNNLRQLEEIFSEFHTWDIDLKMIEDGICHLFVVYFELFLDADKMFKISTNPLVVSETCPCWEQAIFSNPHSKKMETDEEINLTMIACRDLLCITHVDNEDITVDNCYDDEACQCCLVTSEAITLMNFDQLHCVYRKLLHNLLPNAQNSNFSFLEISPFPLFSTMVMKTHKNGVANGNYHPLPMDNVTGAETFLYLNNIEDEDCTIRGNVNRLRQNERFDYIVFEPVLESGLLNEEFYKKIATWQRRLTTNGMFLPTAVTLCFELVESCYLETCTQVLDENLLGAEIAAVMNRYAVMEMRWLSGNFERRCLSTIGRKGIVNDEDSHEDIVTVQVINDGRLTGFLYWFECWYFNEDNTLSTRDSSYNMGAFVLERGHNVRVSKDMRVDVRVRQDCGLLKISL